MSTAAPTLPPVLREGDRLSREEFLRRWEAMPELKHAELLDGVVYVPSPVGYQHNAFHSILNGWLFLYAAATPGCETGADGTWLMGPSDVSQPDITMRILPEKGGRSKVVNGLLSGAPELVVEPYDNLPRFGTHVRPVPQEWRRGVSHRCHPETGNRLA